MRNKILIWVCSILGTLGIHAQVLPSLETSLAGVYQGKSLFIQNPFSKSDKDFCVRMIYINEEPLQINYKLSALKVDFDEYHLYEPVKIRIEHKDTLCAPIIINPEAILFHTIFRFESIVLADSGLFWNTKGETGIGEFEIERLWNGIWRDQEVVKASGKYEGASYSYKPSFEEGPNTYRIKYYFPKGGRVKYLYSWEFDYNHYPDPVDFSPKSAKTRLYLSRASHYEIYNAKQKLVLEGQGKEIDVTVLRRGQYVIYFDGRDPGSFVKE